MRATLILCYTGSGSQEALRSNLTITIDDGSSPGRVRAAEQDTSVNSILRDYLEAYAASGSDLGAGGGRNPPALSAATVEEARGRLEVDLIDR